MSLFPLYFVNFSLRFFHAPALDKKNRGCPIDYSRKPAGNEATSSVQTEESIAGTTGKRGTQRSSEGVPYRPKCIGVSYRNRERSSGPV